MPMTLPSRVKTEPSAVGAVQGLAEGVRVEVGSSSTPGVAKVVAVAMPNREVGIGVCVERGVAKFKATQRTGTTRGPDPDRSLPRQGSGVEIGEDATSLSV